MVSMENSVITCDYATVETAIREVINVSEI